MAISRSDPVECRTKCHVEADMLMVLLAMIEVGRTSVGRATRWLWMLLSGGLWLGQQGCLTPQSPCGSPPDSQTPTDDVPEASDLSSVDVPILPDVLADCPAMAYYGPQPCETSADCVVRQGPGWYCDTANVFIDGCGQQVAWPLCRPGDVPLDVLTPDVPVDALPDCLPMVSYGPPPCTTNDQCVNDFGVGYVCNQNNPVDDGCGGTVNLPICEPKTP